MFFRSKKLVVAALLMASTTSVFAAGTVSGTNVDSTASLSFTVNGTESEVTSTNTYKVDNKVDLSVSTVDAQAVTVSPGTTSVVLSFKVKNDGNTVQDFLLSSAEAAGAFSGDNAVTDTTNFSNVKVVVDNGDGTYDPNDDTATFIDELDPDTDKTVFIVADVPSDSVNDDIAAYDLVAQVAEGSTDGEGTVISSDDSNQVDDAATVQIVFADSAGSSDSEHDGIFSSSDAWKVVTATVTVTKDSIVVSDPVNGENNPKRIPGAVIRYCYIVKNADGGADATGALVTDTLSTTILNTAGQTVATYSGTGTCDCNTDDSEITGENGENGQDPDAQGQVKVDFGTVSGGSTECAYVSATIK